MGKTSGRRNREHGADLARARRPHGVRWALAAGWLVVVTPLLTAARLTIAIEPRWGQDALTIPSGPVTTDAGQTLRVTRVAAIVSGVSLLRADGGTVRLDGQYGAIDLERGKREFTVQEVPEGGYVGLEFHVGVPPEMNHGDPGRWPAGHALNPLVNGLHWSWQGGYVFAAVEGAWRAGAAERGFVYHLATDERLMTVRFRADFTIAGDSAVRLALNLARVLAKHRLEPDDASESTHSGAGDALAPKLAEAWERAWFWLGAASRTDETGRASAGAERSLRARSDAGPTPRAFTVPAGFPQPALPADNPLTVEGVALGAALFNDARLSGNGRQSCASCHDAAHAFSDTRALSNGARGEPGRRNAMPLFNLAWNEAFAWDGSQPRVRDQAFAAWTNPIEMDGVPAQVVARLADDSALTLKCFAAFGPGGLTVERVTLALEQYLLTLVSADSRFDRAMRGEAELTVDEQRGFELFAREYDPARGQRGADCFHCHGGALFTDTALKNNGLDRVSADPGRAGVTGAETDRGKFKTPSLRNVALTAPYMHDGRFATLEEVVAHYDHGVVRSAALDPNLAKHPDRGLELSAADQRALVAFLRTLTDVGWNASGDGGR
ncbi:MbnP family protein [Horticoccus sp. 23ND18S-11]|uniref:MbnP family protein n=1 Tax=Horticoccus sp. 23ND18S-11 TaxID=3391832 RepID=UPI0039C9CF2A